jgi:hypothetical protein
VLLLVIGGIWLLSQSILLGSLDKLDEEKIKDSARQLHRGLQQELLSLSQLSRDWAWWDDSAEFMQQPSQAFIDANLEEDTLSTLSLNFILYFDSQGKLVQAQWSKPSASDLPKLLEFQQLQTQTITALGKQGLAHLAPECKRHPQQRVQRSRPAGVRHQYTDHQFGNEHQAAGLSGNGLLCDAFSPARDSGAPADTLRTEAVAVSPARLPDFRRG